MHANSHTPKCAGSLQVQRKHWVIFAVRMCVQLSTRLSGVGCRRVPLRAVTAHGAHCQVLKGRRFGVASALQAQRLICSVKIMSRRPWILSSRSYTIDRSTEGTP